MEAIVASDYDVFPNGFTDSDIERLSCGGTTYQASRVPCFVSFPGFEAIDRWCRALMAYKPQPNDQHQGRPHVSDMTIAQTMAPDLNHHSGSTDILKELWTAGWQKAKLIHFNNDSMFRARFMPKHAHIPRLLANIKNT